MNNLTEEFNDIIEKYKYSKITVTEVITSNGKYPDELTYLKNNLTSDIIKNLEKLMIILNVVRKEYDRPMIISCGFRNVEHNIKVGGSKNSLHCFCGACDISDPKGELDKWLVNHKKFLKENGIFCEHPFYTKNWSHIQFVESKSKNTFFIPYAGEPKTKDRDESFRFI